MTDDIVKQLAWLREEFYDIDGVTAIVEVAAAEIERLRAERDMLADAVTAQVSPDLSPETAQLVLRAAIWELERRHG